MDARAARRIRGRAVALIPQSPMTALNAQVSLRSHFVEAWSAHQSTGRIALDARLRELMAQVQLPIDDSSFLSRKPGQISVGQAQRVLIALALLHRPAIVIADEPTSALDPVTQAEIVKLLGQLARQNGMALLYISHDLVSVLQLCGRIAVLDSGTIVECMPVAEIDQARNPATLSLLRALPVPARFLLDHFSSHSNTCELDQLPELILPASPATNLKEELGCGDMPRGPALRAFLTRTKRELTSS
jgi:ABC-type dipeptide/oligopeptide/nickel transport system ATPase component